MKNLIYLFCISFLLIGCGSDDSSDSNDDDPMLDNTPYYVSFRESQMNFDSRANQSVGFESFVAEGIDDFSFIITTNFLTTDGQIIAFVMTLYGESFDEIQNNLEIDGQNLDFDLEFIYSRSSLIDGIDFSGSIDTGGEVYLKILSIDRDNKIISGNFNFVAESNDDTSTRSITNGFFNVDY